MANFQTFQQRDKLLCLLLSHTTITYHWLYAKCNLIALQKVTPTRYITIPMCFRVTQAHGGLYI